MSSLLSQLYRAFAEAPALTGRRLRVYLWLLFGLNAAVALAWLGLALTHGGLAQEGKALGSDFTSFWAASKLALSGHAALAYQTEPHWAAQKAIFGGREVGYSAFFYPPTYLLICLPLALLPYLVSLFAWLGATALMAWRAVKTWTGENLFLASAAFPAVWVTEGHGQNAFLTTALMGAGLAGLDKRPWLAGVAFGLLTFKPHLGLLIPVLLLLNGRWRSIASASVTAILLALLATWVFGPDIWRAYLAAGPLAKQSLEEGLVGFEKMQSLFAAVRLWGGGIALGYVVQGLGALSAIALLIWARLRGASLAAQAALMATGTLLTTPFLLDYDLMLLALPLAYLYREGRANGFRPWEKAVMLAAFIAPEVVRSLAREAHLPLTPLIVAAVLALITQRIISSDNPR
jgi:alpha-1,2-mannosyltransferase